MSDAAHVQSATDMNYSTLLVEISDGIATITLNRPERLNCFNRTMVLEFRDLWVKLRVDPDVRVLVLRAAPGRAFCSGVDVKEGWRAPGEDRTPFDQEDPGEWLGPKSNKVWKPFIVAVHGMAAGGAFYWLNEADIVICTEDATFFDPHLKFGKISAVEPIGAMGRIPLQEITRMVLLADAERIGAATALRISLVTEVTTAQALWPRAQELAAMIAQRHPVAVQGSLRAIWEAQSLPRAQALTNALRYIQVGKPLATDPVPAELSSKGWTVR
jgi:enoyl-CoA hydratase/carnithine racemase